MKTFFIFFVLFLYTKASFAQLTQGTWLVGGNGSFYSYNENFTAPASSTSSFTAKYDNIDLSISAGYLITNKLVTGLRPYLSILNGSSSGGGTAKNFKFSIGPFARYYFLEETKQFNLLVDASYQFGINKSGDLKGKLNILSLMAGTEFFLNSAVGLEMLIGYRNQLTSFENSLNAYSDIRKGLYTSIGFQIHLEK